jgi:DNA repair protein RAD16
VVCPVIALTQWRSEIARHCSSAQPLRVLIYHGPKRAVTAETLADFDVVLTTYSVLEVEWRKMVEPTKTACAYCGKAFLEAKLRVHNRSFCGPRRGPKRCGRGSPGGPAPPPLSAMGAA